MATVKALAEAFDEKTAGKMEQVPSSTAETSSKDASPTTNETADSDAKTNALQAALARFEMEAIDDAISELDLNKLYLDKAKYRTPIHELVSCYASYNVAERPTGLHIKCIDIIAHLIKAGVDINDADANKQTALHLAANAAGSAPIIKVLLASGSKVNSPDNGHQRPLHKAALVGCREGVEALLEGGADPNLPDIMGHCPLHVAAKRKKNVAVIQTLVKCGANVNQQDTGCSKCGPTALHLAARAGKAANVETLLGLGAKVDVLDSSGQTPLHLAAAHDVSGTSVAVLLEAGAHVNKRDTVFRETALLKAMKYGMLDNVKYLLRAKADPNLQDYILETPLHKAAVSCKETALWTMMLKAGGTIDVRNNQGQTVLGKALKMKNDIAIGTMKQFRQKEQDTHRMP